MSSTAPTVVEEAAGDGWTGVENTEPAMLKSARAAWTGYAVGMVVLAAAAALITQDAYLTTLMTGGLVFAGLAVAWNILGGYGGQFSLGHAVFFGIGGYSVALLKVDHGLPYPVGILVGMVLSAVLAVALSWPLFRLKGPFFSIGTLALSEVALTLATYFKWTGGTRGVQIPFRALPITDPNVWAAVFVGYLAVSLAVSLAVVRSRLGYYLVAVRDDQEAASASGADPLFVKATAFAISAALTGLGGGLFVLYVGFLDPPSFLSAINVGAFIPLLALIGGIGTLVGPVLGAFLLQPGESYLRGALAGASPGLSNGLVGVLLVLAALFFREGIWGKAQHLRHRFRRDRQADDDRG
ncbi:MAG: branched-chain amino acid ABC transporter permease [Mycobacteriales bacterium]